MHINDDSRSPPRAAKSPAESPLRLSGVEVRREGRVEPLLRADPRLSSVPAHWSGIAFEDHSVPAGVIPRHEHVENFLHVVLEGSVRYEVLTRGKTFKFSANPGTTFVLPRGTVDESRWSGPTHRIAVAIHPSLLVNALDETAHESDIELIEHWNLTDRNIMSVLLAMRTDLDAGSPAGRLYGESLANALAVYLLKRYAIRQYAPSAYRGGLPSYRLKRVLDYIGDNLCDDLSLSQLAAIAGMSPHYFAELCSDRARAALRTGTYSCSESSAPKNACVTRIAASLKRRWTPAFRTRVISPACFGSSSESVHQDSNR